jgi:adenylate cyclase
MPDGPHLVVHAGERAVSLDAGRHWTVGRSSDNQILIDDVSISRRHALLQRLEDGEVYLIDLGSRNGTFVNDRRVSVPTIVRDGDRLRFGAAECTFHWPGVARSDTIMPQGPDTSLLQIRRLISVVVIDIRDYTGLTRRTDEQVLSQVMAEWFQRVGAIVQRAGGHVDKYIGDAVMAVWFHGQGLVDPMDMLRIVRALDAINGQTALLHTTFGLPSPVRVGAGVNTGFAVTGNTGTSDRPDYTAIGDTVNAAFRLESATKTLGKDVAVGDATWAHMQVVVSGDDLFERRTIEMKGYEAPVVAYVAEFAALGALLQRITSAG